MRQARRSLGEVLFPERDSSGLASFSAQVPCDGSPDGGWEALWNTGSAALGTSSMEAGSSQLAGAPAMGSGAAAVAVGAAASGSAVTHAAGSGIGSLSSNGNRTRTGTPNPVGKKKTIFFSRDYRYLKRPSVFSMVVSLLLVFGVVAVYILNYSNLTRGLCAWAGKIVDAVANTTTYTVSTPFVPNMGQMYYLAVESTLPSFALLIITGIICILIGIFAVQSVRNTLPVGIYVCMGSYLALISVIFFLFWPNSFPYTLSEYSELYMKQQLVLWIFIPMVAALAVFMVDKKPSAALLTFFIITAISFVFGCIRYPIYLVILHSGSSLFMAPLFFTLGVLFDFLQMVAIYIVYIRYMSSHLDSFENKDEWQW